MLGGKKFQLKVNPTSANANWFFWSFCNFPSLLAPRFAVSGLSSRLREAVGNPALSLEVEPAVRKGSSCRQSAGAFFGCILLESAVSEKVDEG